MGMPVKYVYMTAGVLTVLSVPESVALPPGRNENIDIDKRSVSCISGFYYDDAVGHCQACITCGRGEYFNDDCYGMEGPGTCSPCDRGFYQSKENHDDATCSHCKHCQNRVTVSRCTPTQNTVCGDCLPGFYEKMIFNTRRCVECPSRGRLPQPCKKKPTTTSVPPAQPMTITPTLMTSSQLVTTTPNTTPSVSSTTLLVTPTPFTTDHPSTTTVSLDRSTETPLPTGAFSTETAMPLIEIPSKAHSPLGLWSAIASVIFLVLVIVFGWLPYKRGCKSCWNSSSGISLPVDDGTHEHTQSYREVTQQSDEDGNIIRQNIGVEERKLMPSATQQSLVSQCSTATSSYNSSSTSSPRDSWPLNYDVNSQWIPSFNGQEIIWISPDKRQKKEMEPGCCSSDFNSNQKQLLAFICMKIDEESGKKILDDFKSFCRLSEKLETRTTEDCMSFADCVWSLVQHNDLDPDEAAAFLYSYFESKNNKRCLKLIREKFPQVSSGGQTFPSSDVSPTDLQLIASCDVKYYRKIVEYLGKNGMTALKLKDITSIVPAIDSMLETDIKGVGSMFAIAVALNVNPEVAHSLKRYRSLEHLLTMSNPDLTVIEFVKILTLHNRIAAVKEIYEKLLSLSNPEDFRRHLCQREALSECGFKKWNQL